MKRDFNYIYLFRHGQTVYNRDKKFTGSIDSKLTKLGKRQSIEIAKKLKSKKIQVAIHTSLSRSKDTLAPVLKNHPECKFIIEDDRMIERSYGKLQGIRHKIFIEEYGKSSFDLVHRDYNTRPIGGESFSDVEKRVKSFIEDLNNFIKKNKVNVAISAHGNSIRLFRKIIEKASVKETQSWSIPYDKVYTYNI